MCVYERGRDTKRDGQLKRQAEVCVCVCIREGETERRTVKETGRGVCACMREGERRTVKETGRGVCVCMREGETDS